MTFSPVLDASGRPFRRAPERPKRVRASYDAASTTRHNERHWTNADSKSADAAHSPDVRRKLRERARYEAQESNSYAKGAVLTLANDTIGTGPRLQLSIPGRADAARFIEREFMLWTYEVRLAEKLRTMRMAKAVDGEAFAAFVTNPALPTRVQLDLELIECDRVKAPWMLPDPDDAGDGITYDAAGNPRSYTVFRDHPGTDYVTEYGAYDTVAAADMIHLFRKDRPGQRRGVSELAPALPVFADLRAFAQFTIDAAKWAASQCGVLYTDDADPEDDDSVPGEAIDVERNSLLVLDNGRKLAQLKAEHPATTYEMFHREKLREAARCLNMPYNVAAGDSSRYNYASGRLDHQTYDRSLAVEQDFIASVVLDRIFLRWLEEAMLLPPALDAATRRPKPYLPEGLPPFVEWDWLWFWDARPHVDPLKEASSAALKLESGQTNLAEIGAKDGIDWEERQKQTAREMGLSLPDYRKLLVLQRFANGNTLTEAVMQVLGEEMAAEAADEAARERETADAA
jgi:lambda family phage portal protein